MDVRDISFNDIMAYLLGSKTCIDSLRVDIEDLQNVIHDIVGKTGSIKCHSWKFPDKLATDVDINELLERYQYGKSELDNQVSHIVLFEIIIDRLLLVLHGSWRFLHENQSKLLPNTIDSSSTINQQTSLSVGLVVKKYWNKLLHIFTTLQQHTVPPDDIEKIHRQQTKSNGNIEKHSQTIETSFSPCSSCTKLQQCLRDSSDRIINLCDKYNLPSSLAYRRCSLSITTPEWLSSNDITHWFDSQSKDFDCLSKHLEYLNNTLNKTKTDFDLSENHCKQQTETNHRLEQIIQEDKQSKKALEELHEKKLSAIKKEYDQHEVNFNEQIKYLTIQKNNLQQQCKEMNDECTSRGEQIKNLELSKNELKILTEDRLKSDELIKILEQKHIRLQTELDVIKRDLEERNQDLKKERLRIENMIRQEESHQAKQKTLTKSYEELSQECQSLKKQIIELESQRDEFQKTSSDITQTNNHVLQEVASLKSNVEQLHQQINEREQYSDLTRHIQTTPTLDNLVCETKNQSRQDSSYRQYSNANETKPKQRPLWLLNNEILDQQQAFTEIKPVTITNCIPRLNETDYAANGRIKSNPDVIQQHNHSWTTTESRPAIRTQSSSRTLTLTILPPSNHETIDKGRSKTSTSNRPLSSEHTQRNSSSTKIRRSSTAPVTHRCTNCKKSYDDKRNYDIHKLYCRT